MFDIKWIRENPDKFDEGIGRRGLAPMAQSIVELDDKRRSHVTELQEAQEKRNAASKEIGKAKSNGDEAAANAAIEEVAKLKSFLQSGEEESKRLADAVTNVLAGIPNLPHEGVPEGADESDNVELHLRGEKPDLGFEAKEHYELGEMRWRLERANCQNSKRICFAQQMAGGLFLRLKFR